MDITGFVKGVLVQWQDRILVDGAWKWILPAVAMATILSLVLIKAAMLLWKWSNAIIAGSGFIVLTIALYLFVTAPVVEHVRSTSMEVPTRHDRGAPVTSIVPRQPFVVRMPSTGKQPSMMRYMIVGDIPDSVIDYCQKILPDEDFEDCLKKTLMIAD